MWKVGDECWYLTSRGRLKKGTVSRTVKHLHTDELLIAEVCDSKYFYVPVSHYECAETPERLIEILRRRATIRLECAKKNLVAAQRRVDDFDTRIQAMLDAAGGEE